MRHWIPDTTRNAYSYICLHTTPLDSALLIVQHNAGVHSNPCSVVPQSSPTDSYEMKAQGHQRGEYTKDVSLTLNEELPEVYIHVVLYSVVNVLLR